MGTKRRILLVDDEETFANALKLYLEKTERFAVRVENRGESAYEAVRIFRPDLVLLDVIMPDMDGGAVAAQIKEDPTLSRTPILFLTAAMSREEASPKSNTIGGQKFIPKPVSAREVLTYIDQTIGKDTGKPQQAS